MKTFECTDLLGNPADTTQAETNRYTDRRETTKHTDTLITSGVQEVKGRGPSVTSRGPVNT